MSILTNQKSHWQHSEHLKDFISEQMGGNSLLRNKVSYLETAVNISNSLSLIMSSQGCSCSILVSLEHDTESLQHMSAVWSHLLSWWAEPGQAMHWRHEFLQHPWGAPHTSTPKGLTYTWAGNHARGDTNQVFTRTGRQLSSLTFSNVITHIALKGELQSSVYSGFQQNNKAFHNSWKHPEYFSDDFLTKHSDRADTDSLSCC